MNWTLYGANGQKFDLTDCGAKVVLGAASVGAYGLPPVTFGRTDSSFLTAGSRRSAARKGDRIIAIRVVFQTAGDDDLADWIEQVAAALDPQWGDCRIVLERNDGTKRDITAAYSSGLDPEVKWDSRGRANCRLLFRAHDPYFRSLESETLTITFPVTGSGMSSTLLDDPDVLLDDPNVPLDGYISSAADNTIAATIVNPGSADAWPVWTVSGAMTGVLLTNVDTGKQFGLTLTTVDLETLTIDMTERQRLIEVDGANAWKYKDPGAEWWSIRPGPNYLIVQVLGADSGTRCQMSFRPRFLSP